MRLLRVAYAALVALSAVVPCSLADAPPPRYSFTLWDWLPTYQDLDRFKLQVDDCKRAGFSVIELGVGWPDCEPEPGEFTFAVPCERIAYIESNNLAIRLRVNVLDWPDWFEPELARLPDGTDISAHGGVPSIFSGDNREHQARFVDALARRFAGHGYTYSPGFSTHMEVKFGAWNTYETAAKRAYRDWLAGRYGNIEDLNRAWSSDHASFAQIEPPVPAATHGVPSINPAETDWIRFREWALADYVQQFADIVRAADPSARISVPLGESWRRESAAFANLAYAEYARSADEVVHSFDFFWHDPGDLRAVQTAVAAMRGITQKPVIFEVDGVAPMEQHGWTTETYSAAAKEAMIAGASGVQITNWGESEVRGQTWMRELGTVVRRSKGSPSESPVLYYVSKWQSYNFREADEALHEELFGFWTRLVDAGIVARIVTDANLLNENLNPSAIVIPACRVIDEPVRDRLRTLSWSAPIIADLKPGRFTPTSVTEGNFGARIERTDVAFTDDPDAVQKVKAILERPRQRIRVAAAQFHTTFDVSQNVERMIGYLCEAAAKGVRVVAFPEMALTGYSKRPELSGQFDWPAIDGATRRLQEICRENDIYAILGLPRRDGGAYFCSSIAIDPQGRIIDDYDKMYLAGEAWAAAGTRMTTFAIDGARSATFICHDERYPHLVQLRALDGAKLFFYISCESGVFEEHKLNPYRAQVQARAVENGVFIVHANAPSNPDDPSAENGSHGQSRIVAPDGNLMAEAGIDEETMVIADIDLSYLESGKTPRALNEGPAAPWLRDGIDGLVTSK